MPSGAWVAALIVGTIAAFAPQLFNDGDTWMHLAAGQRMLDLGAVLRTDPFSYTFAGRPWQMHEWLAEGVMALAWRPGGWAGVAALLALASGLTAGLLTRHVGRWLQGVPLAVVVALALLCLAPALLARPHILALPFLEMWTAELVIAREARRLPSWRRLVPIMVVWANLHGSFIFGLGLLGAFGLEAMWRERRRGLGTLWPWIGLGAGAAVGAMISPHGLNNLLFPLKLNGMATLAGIREWAPIDFDRNPGFEIALLACLFVFGWKKISAPVASLLLLLLLVHLTLHHARHVQLFAVVAPLLLAEPLSRAFGGPPAGISRDPWPTVMGLACALALLTARLGLPFTPADSPVAPGAALAHVPPQLRRLPTFNAYPFGGYLIFEGVAPYIDSRAEVYGDAFRAKFLDLQSGDADAFRQEVARCQIAWTILPPGSPLVAVLDHAPDWRRLYADRFAVVHLRRGAPLWRGSGKR